METSSEPLDAAWFDAWRGILFAQASVLRSLEERLEAHSGLSMAFLDVLSRLYDAPGNTLRMQELQQRSLFTRSGMTRLVDRVEAAGLVRRGAVPGDRRGVSVVLTPEGRACFEAAFQRHRQDLEEIFAPRLTPAQHRAVGAALAPFWQEPTD